MNATDESSQPKMDFTTEFFFRSYLRERPKKLGGRTAGDNGYRDISPGASRAERCGEAAAENERQRPRFVSDASSPPPGPGSIRQGEVWEQRLGQPLTTSRDDPGTRHPPNARKLRHP